MVRYLPDDLGRQNKSVHNFIWSIGQWKGRRLVAVPLEYLCRYVKKTPKKNELNLWKMASAEIRRRGYQEDGIHVTEHAVERYSQRWADVLMRVQRYTGRPIGIITIMKQLFKKAIIKGITSKADGNNGLNNNVRFGKYRWLYGYYYTDKEKAVTEMRIISVFPNKK